ncbi:hypothetical protein VE01_04245 [Pseudogymnoascus verrucosus]|uniref:Uncharacterized protein n=1 Tax=Pseudogymnoascus verrucosus TaxID=342668 RepID=A0A1B8GLN7_9PEZI|nr:uncharacterized protein VE01_04245 [Pseudogymnoascus verrucosus]OBT96749.1 hypothetical protein VE01_04245 [Pseudogymnoascus verrucosus]
MVFFKVADMEEPKYDLTRPFPDLEVLFKYKFLNTPDKSIMGTKVTHPPNASTPPYTHAGAFVAVHVLTGSVLNKMNDNPMIVFTRLQDACRHRINDNACKTEEASLFVTMVMDTGKMEAILEKDGVAGLVVIDEEYRQEVMAQIMKLQAEQQGS